MCACFTTIGNSNNSASLIKAMWFMEGCWSLEVSGGVGFSETWDGSLPPVFVLCVVVALNITLYT
jgi:hypothetical protein